MQMTELTKKASLQTLRVCGHFAAEELRHLELDGWRVVWQEVPEKKRLRKTTQRNKNGIAIGRVV